MSFFAIRMLENKITYLSLGSNIGNRYEYLKSALSLIRENISNSIKISSIYQTPAWGFESEDFYNICIEIISNDTPIALLNKLKQIEIEVGRTEKSIEGYSARVIDIDIITYGNLIYKAKDLTIPHPRLHERLFVLIPLKEIAPNLIIPNLEQSVNSLLEICNDKSVIKKVDLKF